MARQTAQHVVGDVRTIPPITRHTHPATRLLVVEDPEPCRAAPPADRVPVGLLVLRR